MAPGVGRGAVVAHRGASATEPENTLRAFDAAVVAGADAVEFDVRLTADDVPVVLHDETLDRTTALSGPVRAIGSAELRSGATAPDGSPAVPTLEEALRLLSGRVAVDLEIKHGADPPVAEIVDAVVATLDRVGFDGPLLVTSFDPAALARARELGLSTGLLSMPAVDARATIGFAAREGHGWALPGLGSLRGIVGAAVSEARADGVRLGTWVSDGPDEVVLLLRQGLDAVATNDPGPVVAAVREAFGR